MSQKRRKVSTQQTHPSTTSESAALFASELRDRARTARARAKVEGRAKGLACVQALFASGKYERELRKYLRKAADNGCMSFPGLVKFTAIDSIGVTVYIDIGEKTIIRFDSLDAFVARTEDAELKKIVQYMCVKSASRRIAMRCVADEISKRFGLVCKVNLTGNRASIDGTWEVKDTDNKD